MFVRIPNRAASLSYAPPKVLSKGILCSVPRKTVDRVRGAVNIFEPRSNAKRCEHEQDEGHQVFRIDRRGGSLDELGEHPDVVAKEVEVAVSRSTKE